MVDVNSTKRITRASPPASSKNIASPASSIRLTVGARSETGYVREENQDRMSGSQTSLGRLFIVADGMGGYTGGSYAAELTVQTIAECLKNADTQLPPSQILKSALEEANRVVFERARSDNSQYKKMGSTVVATLISDSQALIAHVGDSRAYLHRKGRLKRLTRDHTVGNHMIDMKILTEKQAESHPDAQLLERGIGKSDTTHVEITGPLKLRPEDGVLLCSDGLCGYASDAEIIHVLNQSNNESKQTRRHNYSQLLADRLVDLALEKGGEDNITVQYIKYLAGPCPRRFFRELFILFFGILIGLGSYYINQKYPDITSSLTLWAEQISTPETNGEGDENSNAADDSTGDENLNVADDSTGDENSNVAEDSTGDETNPSDDDEDVKSGENKGEPSTGNKD